MSFLSLRDKIIDTVVFDFDGTLAKLNIDFNQMRRVIDGLILRYGVDDQPLQNVHVLEKILEVQTIL
jgi:phosphoglycolate phosphatase-like HAD superfamily hydrolase